MWLRTKACIPEDVFVCSNKNLKSLTIPIQLRSRKANRSVQCTALVDSGATGSFISWRLVARHRMKKVPLPKPITICNADDTTNKLGQITHQVFLAVKTQSHQEVLHLYVSDIGEDDIL